MREGRNMHIAAVNTHPCEQCQRLGFDPPWQLVAELTYTCARKGSVRTTLCLSRHLAEFLAEYADGTGPLTVGCSVPSDSRRNHVADSEGGCGVKG
jgi:hypothetical protein